MGVSGVGGAGGGATGITATKPANSDPVQDFMNYMKESPAERMQDAWLSSHGITKAQFDAMSPAEKKALMDQMKAEIEMKLKQQAENAGKTAKGAAASL